MQIIPCCVSLLVTASTNSKITVKTDSKTCLTFMSCSFSRASNPVNKMKNKYKKANRFGIPYWSWNPCQIKFSMVSLKLIQNKAKIRILFILSFREICLPKTYRHTSKRKAGYLGGLSYKRRKNQYFTGDG